MLFTRTSKLSDGDHKDLQVILNDFTMISHCGVESYELCDVCVVVKTKEAIYRYDAKDVRTIRLSISYSYSK